MREDVIIPHEKKHIVLDLFGGDEIDDVVCRSAALSAMESCSVEFEFNGIDVLVDVRSVVTKAIDDYYKASKERVS